MDSYTDSPLLPKCPPNTAESNSSSLELDNLLPDADDPKLPLNSFDSSSLSLGLPWDSQGFALGIETWESGTDGLSLPSEPPELDLRDWILRHRIEPPHEKSHDGALTDSQSRPEKTQFREPPAQTQKDAKKVSVFSRKNWDALLSSISVDDGMVEELHLASMLKKQRTNNQSLSARRTKDVEGLSKTLRLDVVSDKDELKEESDKIYMEFPSLVALHCETEDTISPDLETEDTVVPDSKTVDAVDPDSETEDAVAFDSKTEDAVAPDPEDEEAVVPDSETEDESDHNIVRNVNEFASSPCLFISDIELAEKKNFLQEELAPLPSSRTQRFSTYGLTKSLSYFGKLQSISDISSEEKENLFQEKLAPMPSFKSRSSSSDGSRKPLSDSGNFQPQQSADKWLCPRTHKKHFKPPAKQLSLDRWLAPAK